MRRVIRVSLIVSECNKLASRPSWYIRFSRGQCRSWRISRKIPERGITLRTFPLATIETIALSRPESDECAELLSDWGSLDPVSDASKYVLNAQIQSARLPERLRAALVRFRTDGSQHGGLLVRGLPIGSVPATPPHADLGVGSSLDGAKMMSLVAGVLGEQFGFLPELSGSIVQDIIPVPGFEDTQQSISSRVLLELHTETSFTDARADFIGLLCLRPDPQREAATLISPASGVLRLLEADTVGILSQPRFATTVDASFLRGSGLPGPVTVKPVRILSGCSDWPRLRADFAELSGLDPEAQQAVEDLHRAADAAASAIYLDSGDLLIVDNHSAFHGRTPFTVTRDGKDRWLLRMFVARDLARTVASRPGRSRIVDIDYTALAGGGGELHCQR